MPQLHLATSSLLILILVLLSACATTSSVDPAADEAELVNTTEPLPTASRDDEFSDPFSDLMYEVLAGELAGKLGDLDSSKQGHYRCDSGENH